MIWKILSVLLVIAGVIGGWAVFFWAFGQFRQPRRPRHTATQ